MSQIDSVGAWPPAVLARYLASRPADLSAIPDLATAIREFHSRLNLSSPEVEATVSRIEAGSPLVRLAHQPNFLPYQHIVSQLLFVSELAKASQANGLDAAPVVLLVDHDTCSNRRFRRAQTWDPSSKRHTRCIDLPLAKEQLDQPIFCTPAPSLALREQLVDQIRSYSESLSRWNFGDSVATYKPLPIGEVLGANKTFSDMGAFSAHALIYLSVVVWRLDVVFVPLSSLHRALSTHYDRVASRLDGLVGRDRLYWRRCLGCGRRVAITSNCNSCGAPVSPGGADLVQLLPRVLLDDLTDYTALGVIGGTSYRGGLTHLVQSHEYGVRAGLPIGLESCWKAPVLHASGPAETGMAATYEDGLNESLRPAVDLVLSGRQSLAYYLAFPWLLEELRATMLDLFATSPVLDIAGPTLAVSSGIDNRSTKVARSLAGLQTDREA